MKIPKSRAVYFVMILAAFFVPSLFISSSGIQLHTVATGSMRPGIKPGAVIVTHSTTMASLKKGDVIIYFDSHINDVISHRIISITDKGQQLSIVTKGDANPLPDPAILEFKSTKVAKVGWVIPGAGFLVSALHSTAGKFGVMGFLLLTPLSMFIENRLRRKKKSIQELKPSEELVPVLTTNPNNLEGTNTNENN